MIDLQLLWIFAHRRINIYDCRVAFETEIFLPQKEDWLLPTKIAGSDLKVLRTCSVIKMKVWTIPA